MSTYVISDIHGCYDELMQMLEKIQFTDKDMLICAGDYINKGTQNAEILNWIMNVPGNIILVRGNHDEEYIHDVEILRMICEKMNLDATKLKDSRILYQSIEKLTKQEDSILIDPCGTIGTLINENGYTMFQLCQWAERMKRMPFFYKIKIGDRTCVVVHAGYRGHFDLPEMREKYNCMEEFYLNAREDSYMWGGIHHGMVVAGHTPTVKDGAFSYNDGKVFRVYRKDLDCIFYDIDCGCWMRHFKENARLACLRLDDEAVFYV